MLYIKDKVKHISDVIYKGTCNCKEEYYGVTHRIAEIRWREHENPNKDSNPSKHLINNTTHAFTWEIVRRTPHHFTRRKILEAFYIRKFEPTINSQQDIRNILLFKNGMT